ncbi:uncharacterized protein EV422DRAFT_11677 [Fimicolochytrium jonesii]|uniref:uncharacterized protein n=1 Tax=Fimicolochytrium jonesii TaxID=1396493 RepID=UPI0022FF4025|nr:uncharacterized protein EV422DRAFT_11677 [Fimicolochytrium jonesii]KAI8826810.1 hypothetical protein EV422DRAFT_11677 [Fimicolochytrium jonesii]
MPTQLPPSPQRGAPSTSTYTSQHPTGGGRSGTSIFRTALQKITLYFTSLTLGTTIIIGLCVFIHLLNILFSLTDNFCLQSPAYFSSPLSSFPKLFTNHFTHTDIFHLIGNMFVFPAVAGPLERDLGTFQFLHAVGIILALVASFLYIIVGGVIGVIIKAIGQQCSLGLSGLIFALMTVEAWQGRPPFEHVHIGSWEILGHYLPWIIFGISSIIYPWSSFVGHLTGILAGILYGMGFLDILLLRPRQLAALRDARIFSGLTRRRNFVDTQGSVALPTTSPGGSARVLNPFGGSSSAPNHKSTTSGSGFFNNFTRNGSQARGGPSYTSLSDDALLNSDNDPLLWDEEPAGVGIVDDIDEAVLDLEGVDGLDGEVEGGGASGDGAASVVVETGGADATPAALGKSTKAEGPPLI